jgi:hypothetical protein
MAAKPRALLKSPAKHTLSAKVVVSVDIQFFAAKKKGCIHL